MILTKEEKIKLDEEFYARFPDLEPEEEFYNRYPALKEIRSDYLLTTFLECLLLENEKLALIYEKAFKYAHKNQLGTMNGL